MATDEHGGVVISHWLHYLITARDARDRSIEVMDADPNMIPGDALVAVLMSALAVEAFVNELAEAADTAGLGKNVESPTLTLFHDLANTLLEVETDRGSVALKYQVAAKILSGHTFDRGAHPFQDLRELISLRDQLVHLRPRDRIDPGGYIVRSVGLIASFQRAGLTRGNEPHADPPDRMPWLTEIETDKMAAWAYRTACGVIAELGRMVPDDWPQSPGTSIQKDRTQTLPD